VPLDRHRQLQERSIQLLQRISWDGVAMVEYRWDEATGRAVLMEINGRFWGSFPLAVQCGAGFARLAHASALGLPLPELPPVREDLRARMVATEVKRLVRILLESGRIADPSFQRRPAAELLRFAADFARSHVRYFVWSADDPRPLLADLRNLLRPGRRGGS
jgi:predicted ATP-grasp superfamily ATP-dependent carboligase